MNSVARNSGEDVESVTVPPAEEFADALADGLAGEVLLASWLGHPIFDAIQDNIFKTELFAAGGLAVALAIGCDAILVAAQRGLTPWTRAKRS